MADPIGGNRSDLDPANRNTPASAEPKQGPPRKFLGVPVWASAVGLAALAAVMYLVMLTLV